MTKIPNSYDYESFLFKLGFGLFLIMLTIALFSRHLDKKASEKLFEQMSTLNFSGKVLKETPLTSRVSLYLVEISASSVEEYDHRNSGEDYLFVIKQDRAELILKSYSLQAGDSIRFHGETGSVQKFKNGKYYNAARKGTYFLGKMRRLAKRKHEL